MESPRDSDLPGRLQDPSENSPNQGAEPGKSKKNGAKLAPFLPVLNQNHRIMTGAGRPDAGSDFGGWTELKFGVTVILAVAPRLAGQAICKEIVKFDDLPCFCSSNLDSAHGSQAECSTPWSTGPSLMSSTRSRLSSNLPWCFG
jgi:hypothetical protein